MCSKVDWDKAVQAKGVSDRKQNLLIKKPFYVFVAPCKCRKDVWAYVPGGTVTKVIEVL